MVLEIRRQTGERHGAVTRVAKELGIGPESLRQWVTRAEVDSGRRPGTSTADAQWTIHVRFACATCGAVRANGTG